MIRVLKANDDYLNELYEIHKTSFESNVMTKANFKDEILHISRIYFMALIDNKIVGYIGLWNTGEDFNIISIAVDKMYRRNGIAKQLLTRAVKEAQLYNIPAMSLEVSELNEPAIKLYRSFGFIITNTRPKYYKDMSDALIMWKYL